MNPALPEAERKALAGTGPFILRERELYAPMRLKKPAVIGVQFMGDLFHDDVPWDFIYDAYEKMASCPRHAFLILTKRPQRMVGFIEHYKARRWKGDYDIINKCFDQDFSHIYHGLTVCNPAEADEKIPIFLQVPGKKFLSLEPLLGPIKLLQYLIRGECIDRCPEGNDCSECNPGFASQFFDHQIDAVILGGETGPGARPMHLDWAISIVQQCKTAGVPVFVKQIHVNGKTSKDISEWPDELRVRELPWVKS